MQFRHAAVCLVLIAGCCRHANRTSDAGVQKNAGQSHAITMFIQGKRGVALLPIRNDTDTPLALNLSSGPVNDATTGSEISGVTVSFETESGRQAIANASQPLAQGSATPPPQAPAQPGSPRGAATPAKPAPPLTVAAHSKMNVQVAVAGLTGTTWARMSVFNQAADLGDLDLVVLDDPLNVAIEGLGSAAATPLSSTYGDTLIVTVKNNSAEFLGLDCWVEVNNSSSRCGKIVLPPNTSKAVPVSLSSCAFSLTDLVQPTVRVGGLKLTTEVPPGTPPEMVPVKLLPLNLTMQAVGPIPLSLLSLFYVGVFLAIGAFLSILASTVLPNLVRKAELRKHIDQLAKRTSSVSTKVDSYLRVLLRLERKKIAVRLNDLRWYSPQAAEEFTDISNLAAGLLKRLTVAERLDKLRRDFEDKSATAPPSISDAIDKNLDTSAVQLHSFVLNDADVVAANAYLDKAEGMLKLLDDKEAQARLIAQNYVQLRNRLQAFPKDYYTDLKQALAGIFNSLNFGDTNGSPPAPKPGNPGNGGDPANTGNSGPAANTGTPGNQAPAANPPGQVPAPAVPAGGSPNDFSDPKNIFAPMFFALDHGIAAIQAVLDYAIVRASVAMGTSKNCSNPGEDAMKRLKDRECQLLNLLGTLSWKSLRGAITLVQQMREDVYEADLYEHFKEKKAKIVFDTQRARPFLPVFFSICFDDPRLNGVAAQDWVALDWTFPHALHEEGWKICHYFEGREGVAAGTPPDQADPDAVKRNVLISVRANSPRWAEALSLDTKIEVQPDNPKAEKAGSRADLLRTAIAFGVALAGLKSGALDQLAKLGFVQATVAIIALGFGADTVKNVLTQSSRPQTPIVPPTPPATPKAGP